MGKWQPAPPSQRKRYVHHAFMGVVEDGDAPYATRSFKAYTRLSGWISPEGVFFPDGRYNDFHGGAKRLADKLGLKGVNMGTWTDYTVGLESAGFAHISIESFSIHSSVATDEQIAAAQALFARELDRKTLYVDDDLTIWNGAAHEGTVRDLMVLSGAAGYAKIKRKTRPDPKPESYFHPVVGKVKVPKRGRRR